MNFTVPQAVGLLADVTGATRREIVKQNDGLEFWVRAFRIQRGDVIFECFCEIICLGI